MIRSFAGSALFLIVGALLPISAHAERFFCRDDDDLSFYVAIDYSVNSVTIQRPSPKGSEDRTSTATITQALVRWYDAATSTKYSLNRRTKALEAEHASGTVTLKCRTPSAH